MPEPTSKVKGAYFVWKFSKLPKQYIAAAGDPKASSGTGA